MAKFHGKIGFAVNGTLRPGVIQEVITEREYYGDVIRYAQGRREDDKINNDRTVSNSISIVADEHANEHFFAIRYVDWAGSLWSVVDIEVQRPRLILRLGGVYNGPRATP